MIMDDAILVPMYYTSNLYAMAEYVEGLEFELEEIPNKVKLMDAVVNK